MERYLNVVQILVSLLLVLTILLQVRGLGSGIFGAAQSSFRVRRGLERTLFQITIVLTVIFVLVSLSAVYIES